MRRLAWMLTLVGALSCSGALRSTVAQVARDEQTLTAICEAAVDHAWDDSQLDEVLAKCDEAYDLHDQIQRAYAALQVEHDEAKRAELEGQLVALAYRFGRLVAELAQGSE